MAKKTKKIPKFKSEDQEREFWSRSDSANYIDWSKARSFVLPNLKSSESSEILRLVEMGDKEISEGRGHSLESVMKEADDLLKDDES